MPPPQIHPTVSQRFGTFFRTLIAAVNSRNGHGTGGLPYQTIQAIVHRLISINLRLRRLIDLVAEGRYVPRPRVTRTKAGPRDPAAPRTPDPLPCARAWLQKLMPEAAAHNGCLDDMLRDPDILAIIAAGPEAMRRSLRSVCRMLGTVPPPVLVRPRPPRAVRPVAERKPRRKTPPDPRALRPDYRPSAHWPAGCGLRRPRTVKIPA